MVRRNQSDIAYEYIKDSVIDKKFFPGTRLVEEEIVRDTGVSRTSVRSALSRLRYEGIVEGTPHHGMAVTRLQRADMQSVFEIRRTLELGALELAITHVTPEMIARMHMKNNMLRRVTENFNISEYVKYNRDFHWEVARATQNRFYEKYLDEVYNTIAVCLLFYNNSADDTRSLGYHQDLIDALAKGDLEAAKRAVINDMNCAIEDAYLHTESK